MLLGIPNECDAEEKRVAIVPEAVSKLKKIGFEVAVEKGAGEGSKFQDSEYESSGARIVDSKQKIYSDSDVIVRINLIKQEEVLNLKLGIVYISLMYPLNNVETVKKLAEKNVTSLALELIPRISRAQSMDVLSSMSSIAGYKAVLIASNHLRRFFPMMMTAAGTIPSAKVLIIGAGVAGLQAIATAKRLGATVDAYDIRPAVREQIESLGAGFVSIEIKSEGAEGKGGYAKAQSEEFYQKQQQLLSDTIAKSDVVITTALIPGKKAPILIKEEAVKRMKPGSVIVDLAAVQGGNCELSEPGKEVEKYGVLISGFNNLPAMMSTHASQLFSRNVFTYLNYLFPEGSLKLDLADEVIREPLVTHEGKIMYEKLNEIISSGANS